MSHVGGDTIFKADPWDVGLANGGRCWGTDEVAGYELEELLLGGEKKNADGANRPKISIWRQASKLPNQA